MLILAAVGVFFAFPGKERGEWTRRAVYALVFVVAEFVAHVSMFHVFGLLWWSDPVADRVSRAPNFPNPEL